MAVLEGCFDHVQKLGDWSAGGVNGADLSALAGKLDLDTQASESRQIRTYLI